MSKKYVLMAFALCLTGISTGFAPAAHAQDATRKSRYDVQELNESIIRPAAELPDITGYSVEKIIARLPMIAPGKISLTPLSQEPVLWKFATAGLLEKFGSLQKNRSPVALVLQNGAFDAETLFAAVNDPAVLEKFGDDYLLHRPLLITNGASLTVRGNPQSPVRFRLSVSEGAFIVNAGEFHSVDAEFAGWDIHTQSYAVFKSDKDFRPFYVAWNGSRTFAGRTDFRSLGYDESKAYGVSLSSDSHILLKNPKLARPSGWFINCHFQDNYYAFYSYEAEDVTIIGNVFEKNIIYGIDPHDRSRHLIIAANKAFDTIKKHGIIVSRDVTDSWIFDNDSHDNHGSGIMLDRNSHHNVVADNLSHDNGAYGIALMESPDNILIRNNVQKNRKDGIKIRNSWDIGMFDNNVTQNQGIGISVVKTDISNDSRRDFVKDPYTKRVGVTLADGTIGNNAKADIAFEGIEKFIISNVDMERLSQNSLQGNLSLSGRDKILTLLRQKKSLALVPNE